MRYARWDGSDWIITTIGENYAGAFNSLALDSQDFPHIAYYQALGSNWNLWYKYWDGSNWHNEVVNQPMGGGWYCRIALDSQEHPRIAYSDQNAYDLDYASPILVGIEDEMTTSKDDASVVLTNYPNPFNPTTTISFFTTKFAKNAKVEIYNITGQKVKTFIIPNPSSLTTNQIIWDGTDENNKPLSSGMYLYKLKSGINQVTKKMILMK